MKLPEHVAGATEFQPAARSALGAALAAGPAHAYLFSGPPGTGKGAAARAFAAEVLALGSDQPEEARRRALLDPSPHPDLVWVSPPGPQHLVDEIRERVIKGAVYRPFEGERRVLVIEAAEAMADESQNALLKTLEEPPEFVVLLLLTAEPSALLPTVRSRCQAVPFRPLPPEAVEALLAGEANGTGTDELRAAARLSAGDPMRARFLVSTDGRELRARAEVCARFARSGEPDDAPWQELLEGAERAGERAAEEVAAAARERVSALGLSGREEARARREAEATAKRAGRKRRTEALDLGLALCASWFRDLAAVSEEAPELALNADRLAELRADAAGLDPRCAREAAERVLDTRRRLRVNVAEELALEALFYEARFVLGDT